MGYFSDFFVNSVALTGHCSRNLYRDRVFIPIESELRLLVFIIVEQSFGITELNSKLYEAHDLLTFRTIYKQIYR